MRGREEKGRERERQKGRERKGSRVIYHTHSLSHSHTPFELRAASWSDTTAWYIVH